MSIITDALKKAEQDRELKLQPQTEETPVPQTIPLPEQEDLSAQILSESVLAQKLELKTEPQIPDLVTVVEDTPKRRYSLALSIGVISLFVLAFLIFPKQSTVVTPASGKNHSAALAQFPKIPSIKLPYVLSGISKVDNNYYAIINGIIVQPGETIDGALVKEINDREATLETRSGKIILSITS